VASVLPDADFTAAVGGGGKTSITVATPAGVGTAVPERGSMPSTCEPRGARASATPPSSNATAAIPSATRIIRFVT
jgi:hypothetical protein